MSGDETLDVSPVVAARRGRVVEGWKGIAAYIGTSVNTARERAARERDPLPVWDDNGAAVAFRTALDAWLDRQLLPLAVARRLQPFASDCNDASE